MGFKEGFLWGGSVSSMQTEGAYDLDGRGVSIYDVRDIDPKYSDWKDGIDYYHRYKQDHDLYQQMSINAIRTSIAWSRVIPDGEGQVNELGLKFYDDIVDDMLSKGIEPIFCLYHFDMPYALMEKYGGWQNRKVLDAYVRYARIIIEHFKGRVKYYIPFNEQNICPMINLVDETNHCEKNQKNRNQIQHHFFMASAWAAIICHETDPNIKCCGMVNYMTIYPKTCKPEDVFASYKADRVLNQQTLEVLATGKYPSDLLQVYKDTGMPEMEDGDLQILEKGKSDVMTFSYYKSFVMDDSLYEKNDLQEELTMKASNNLLDNPYVEKTEWGTFIDPQGLRVAANQIWNNYHLPVFITECGIGVRETPDENGYVDDEYRINYLHEHILALKQAVDEDGVDLIGFLTWGPIDILSSAGDMDKRYGFIYVNRDNHDLKDLKRSKKRSFDWFKQVIESNGEIIK